MQVNGADTIATLDGTELTWDQQLVITAPASDAYRDLTTTRPPGSAFPFSIFRSRTNRPQSTRRRVRATEVVSTQTFVPPTNPDYIFSSRRSIFRGITRRRTNSPSFIQAQQNPPLTPKPVAPSRRLRGMVVRRSRPAPPPSAQDSPIAKGQPRRTRGILRRPTRRPEVVPAQVVVTPNFVPAPTSPRRRGALRRRPRPAAFVPTQTAPVAPTFVPSPTSRRARALRRVRRALPWFLSAQPIVTVGQRGCVHITITDTALITLSASDTALLTLTPTDATLVTLTTTDTAMLSTVASDTALLALSVQEC